MTSQGRYYCLSLVSGLYVSSSAISGCIGVDKAKRFNTWKDVYYHFNAQNDTLRQKAIRDYYKLMAVKLYSTK